MKQQNKKDNNPAPASAKERRLPTTDGRYLTDKEAKAEGLSLLELDLGEEEKTLRRMAKAHGVTVGEELGRMIRQGAGVPPKEGRREPSLKRHLIIVAEMPEAWGRALEHMDEDIGYWVESWLCANLNAEFEGEGGAWETDVKRLFGVSADGTDEAFDVRAAGFVEEEVSASVRRMVEGESSTQTPKERRAAIRATAQAEALRIWQESGNRPGVDENDLTARYNACRAHVRASRKAEGVLDKLAGIASTVVGDVPGTTPESSALAAAARAFIEAARWHAEEWRRIDERLAQTWGDAIRVDSEEKEKAQTLPEVSSPSEEVAV